MDGKNRSHDKRPRPFRHEVEDLLAIDDIRMTDWPEMTVSDRSTGPNDLDGALQKRPSATALAREPTNSGLS